MDFSGSKQDCHAFKGRICGITAHKLCPDNCRFYQTKEQFKQNFLKSKERIDKLPGEVAEGIRGEYSLFRDMCREIAG